MTRINLDRKRDDARRITLLTPVGADGLTHFNAIDGSSYNPFTNTLLFTQETSSAGNGTGAVIQITFDCQSTLNTLGAFFGLGGFEGIHADDKGNVYVIEDYRRYPTGRCGDRAGNRAARAAACRGPTEQLRLPLPAEQPGQAGGWR